jgi:signal transduction histidine kinase
MPRFAIRRFFSVYALLMVALAAVALVVLFRHVTVRSIVEMGEGGNVALARTALGPIRLPLLSYLESVADLTDGERMRRAPIPPSLEFAINDVTAETAVVRIKVYNRHGIVAFSTKHAQIGRAQSDNPGFRSAIGGEVASTLTYRDSFNIFDAESGEDNLIETYLPIQRDPRSPIIGVFEVYTDVSRLVVQAERAEFMMVAIVALVLLLLYGGLVAIVYRAGRIVENREDVIRERTHTLELLSAKLLTGQETERKRIADRLHEGIAQMLSAANMRIEAALMQLEAKGGKHVSESIRAAIPPIQDAIQESRALAVELMPPSLGELGMEDTLAWFARRLHSVFPHLRLELKVRTKSDELSASLRVIVFRILQETLEATARRGRANRAQVTLEKNGDTIVLTIQDDALPLPPGKKMPDTEQRVGLASLQERVALSGGTLELTSFKSGGSRMQIFWPA